MSYRYITNNNLENRQNYMYSQFEGQAFMDAYRDTRSQFCHNNHCAENWKIENSNTGVRLIELLDSLDHEVQISTASKKKIDMYVKSFEVRKRIFSDYDGEKMKPSDEADYHNYDNYILLSRIMIKMYRKTQGLKYLSCLLKVDDTLLSVTDKLSVEQKQAIAFGLEKEMEFIDYLATCKL